MRHLSWMLLVLLLVAGTSLSVAVNQNQLTQITREIVNRYGGGRQFCLAENVPNQWERGRKFDQLIDKAVYAYPENGVHAEPQVLTAGNLETLKGKKNPGEFLLIYSYLSPCTRCTWWEGENNIVDVLYRHVSNMNDAVFAFTEVYKWTNQGHEFSRTDLEKNLNKLGQSMGGLEKVYRCYQPTNLGFECFRCSSATRGRPAEVCVDKYFVPGQGGSGGSGGGGAVAGGSAGSGGAGRRTGGSGRRTGGSGRRTHGAGRRTGGSGRRTRGSGRRTRGSGRRTGGSGRRTRGAGKRTGGSGRRTAWWIRGVFRF